MFQNIMMVCVGNICRSPIAEAYLKSIQSEINVYSSGLSALEGKPADPFSISVMKSIGISLENHRAQQLSAILVSNSDLILTMEQRHVDIIHKRFPSAQGKVYLVGKWDDNREVLDPYGKSMEDFVIASSLIQTGINAWQKELW